MKNLKTLDIIQGIFIFIFGQGLVVFSLYLYNNYYGFLESEKLSITLLILICAYSLMMLIFFTEKQK